MSQMEHLIEKHATYANFLIGCTFLVVFGFLVMVIWYLYQRHKKRRQRREERRQQRSRGGRSKR
jgi:cbb3-type cytochrome oxidase subunit 3